MEPNDRMFDPALVDFHASLVGDFVRIYALLPFPLVAPDMSSGSCIDSAGICSIKMGIGKGDDQCPTANLYLPGEPCAFIDVAEFVKIST